MHFWIHDTILLSKLYEDDSNNVSLLAGSGKQEDEREPARSQENGLIDKDFENNALYTYNIESVL